MEHATALVDHDATTESITVSFVNTVAGGRTVLQRTFESEDAYVAWLDRARGMVEIVSAVLPPTTCVACGEPDTDHVDAFGDAWHTDCLADNLADAAADAFDAEREARYADEAA